MWYRRKGDITDTTPGIHTQYGVRISCGHLLYSSLPEHYELVLGLTGSLECLSEGDKKILDDFHFHRKTLIPSTFQKNLLKIEDMIVVPGDQQDYYSRLYREIEQHFFQNRTQLVVFENNERLLDFRRKFKAIGDMEFRFPEVLNESLPANDRDNLISRSTSKKMITFMTRSFGRGTDFLCADNEVRAAGGVHVILTFFPMIEAEELQIKGRTCRQDNNGSFQMILYGNDLKAESLATDSNLKNNHVTYSFLHKKRKDLNETRYKQMMKSLKESTKKYEITLEMVGQLNEDDSNFGPFQKFLSKEDFGYLSSSFNNRPIAISTTISSVSGSSDLLDEFHAHGNSSSAKKRADLSVEVDDSERTNTDTIPIDEADDDEENDDSLETISLSPHRSDQDNKDNNNNTNDEKQEDEKEEDHRRSSLSPGKLSKISNIFAEIRVKKIISLLSELQDK